MRSRWAAIGAAVAVTLGAGGLYTAQAADDATSGFVAVTPVRALDTRAATNVGLENLFAANAQRTLQITGSIPVVTETDPFATGSQTIVPTGATAVVLNVTGVRPTRNGFISVRPGGAEGRPSTSNINITSGSVVPNSVTVALPQSGDIAIFYGAADGGGTDMVIDIVGYYTSTNFGEQIEALEARIGTLETFEGATPVDAATIGDQITAISDRVDALETAVADLPVEAQQTIPGAMMIADDGSQTVFNRSCMFNQATPLSYVPMSLPVGATITQVDVTAKLFNGNVTPEGFDTDYQLEARTGAQTFAVLGTERHAFPSDFPGNGRVITITPTANAEVKANTSYVVSLAVSNIGALDADDLPGICNVTVTYTLPR